MAPIENKHIIPPRIETVLENNNLIVIIRVIFTQTDTGLNATSQQEIS